jgi:hypothetical protein
LCEELHELRAESFCSLELWGKDSHFRVALLMKKKLTFMAQVFEGKVVEPAKQLSKYDSDYPIKYKKI